MALLQDSPWYQQIVRESELRGEQRAELRTKLSHIEMGLEVRFGNEGLELMPQISDITDLEHLTQILRTIMIANVLEEIQQII